MFSVLSLVLKCNASMSIIQAQKKLMRWWGRPNISISIRISKPSYAYAYGQCCVQWGHVGISVSISISTNERLSANQRALYAYVNHVLTEHNTDISISISFSRRPRIVFRPVSVQTEEVVVIILQLIFSRIGESLSIFRPYCQTPK